MSADGSAVAARRSSGLVREIQRRSGLSQAELARRAGLPRSVLNAYLRGHREPGVETLLRIAAAAGVQIELGERRPRIDPERSGKILAQVIGLAEALPFRPRAEVEYPCLRDRLSRPAAAA